MSRSHLWEYLKRTGEVSTVANYTTGTVSVTNGSRTITGSGTVWDSSFVGRYFQPSGSTNWYRIVTFVSSTNLTLESSISETTQSGIAYKIWTRFYYLNSDVRKIFDFGIWQNTGVILDKSNQFISDRTNDISLVGIPSWVSVYGINPFESKYTTGTISLTQDSTTLTGIGTFWLGNVFPGDLVTVSGKEYRVKRIESDTSIILLNNAITTLSGVTYTIFRDNPLGVQFYLNSDKVYLIFYSYFKRVYNMVNENNDRTELPEEFDQVILDGAEWFRYRETNDPRAQSKFQEYIQRVQDLKIRSGSLSSPRTRQFAPLIPNRSLY